MKLGSIEGTPQEIKDLFENHGLNLAEYIEKPGQHMHKAWLVIPSILFILSLGFVFYVKVNFQNYTLLSLALSLCVLIWVAVSVQVKFSNGWATALTILGPLIIALMVSGYLQPSEIVNELKELKQAEQ